MPLDDIAIDPDTWAAGSEERQIEWEANIQDLLLPGHATLLEGAHLLTIETNEQRYRLILTDAEGETLGEAEVAHHALRDGIHEYVDTVRQIAATTQDGGGVARYEVLDMAKKVVHDKMARIIKRACRPLGVDHDTARRLFTLLLSLRVDTTRLHGVHGHRRIR